MRQLHLLECPKQYEMFSLSRPISVVDLGEQKNLVQIFSKSLRLFG